MPAVNRQIGRYGKLFARFKAQKGAIIANSQTQFGGIRCRPSANAIDQRQFSLAAFSRKLASLAAHLIENRASRRSMRISSLLRASTVSDLDLV
jgi:hypothetical protein